MEQTYFDLRPTRVSMGLLSGPLGNMRFSAAKAASIWRSSSSSDRPGFDQVRSASFFMNDLGIARTCSKARIEKAARPGGRVAHQFTFGRVQQVHHELDHRTRREELTQLAPEGRAEETLEGQPLDVVAGRWRGRSVPAP